MKAEDFLAWLAAISRMNAGQRAEAMAALEKAGEADAVALAKKAGKRGRQEDALGTRGAERVAAQGCPHCAGREIVGWGRSHGLLRFRCKSCGRTFNALTKTPMARLRKKEKWLDHARAMIEGKSLAKTAQLCGMHPTTAFRWRHRFLRAPSANKPRTLRGIVEADETFILESFKGRRSDLPRAARNRGGMARHPGLHSDNIPILVARDRKGATFDAVLPQVDSASLGAALAGVVTPGNPLIGDGGRAIATFARRAGIPFHGPCPRQENPLPKPRICTSTTSTPTTAASSNGSTASTASPQRTCPTTSDGGAPSKPGETNSLRKPGSKAPSETAHINS
ncbi:MAG TPA: IS1595 family transposase [Roseiarcus sp.]